MEMALREIFTFTVAIEELRIICKALRGKLKEEDTQLAEALDRQIAKARIAHAELRNNLRDTQEP